MHNNLEEILVLRWTHFPVCTFALFQDPKCVLCLLMHSRTARQPHTSGCKAAYLYCAEQVEKQVQEALLVPGNVQLLHSLCYELIEDWLQDCVHILELCY